MKSFINSNSFYPSGSAGIIELQNLKVFQIFEGYSVPLAKRLEKGYGWGFNGMERDDEVKGSGNSYAFKYRIHDPRLGRFFSVDPLTHAYPFYSPYQFAGNTPIQAIDIEGLEEFVVTDYYNEFDTEQPYKTEITIINDFRTGKGNNQQYLIHKTRVDVDGEGNLIATYKGSNKSSHGESEYESEFRMLFGHKYEDLDREASFFSKGTFYYEEQDNLGNPIDKRKINKGSTSTIFKKDRKNAPKNDPKGINNIPGNREDRTTSSGGSLNGYAGTPREPATIGVDEPLFNFQGTPKGSKESLPSGQTIERKPAKVD